MIVKRYRFFSETTFDKLIQLAKKNGIVILFRKGTNGFHINKPSEKTITELKKFKESMKPEEYKKFLEDMRKMNLQTIKLEYDLEDLLLGKELIIIGKDSSKERQISILAHEIGHSEYTNGRGGLLGRLAHKGYKFSDRMTSEIGGVGTLISFGSGVVGGIISSKGGMKNNVLGISTASIPVLFALPMLIAEGAASIKGYKILKEAGADDETLRNCKKTLRGAFMTYLGVSIIPVIFSLLGALYSKLE